METDEGTTMFEQSEDNIISNDKSEENGRVSFTNDEQTESTEQLCGWSNICRVCANVNSHIVPIFEAEGAEHELSDKIHKYLPIRVDKTDSLPVQLCYHCAATILAWHELLEGCLDAEKQLLEAEKNYKEESQTKYTENFSSVSEEPLDDSEPTAVDKQGSSSSNQWEEETNNLGEEGTKRSDRGRETFSVFLDKQSIYQRLRRIKSKVNDEKLAQRENPIWREVSCTREENSLNSPEAMTTMTTLEESTITKISKSQRCTTKNLREDVQSTCLDPENSEESLLVETKCTICCQEFIHTEELQNHVTEHKNLVAVRSSYKYKCDECNKGFRLKDSFIRHLRIHRDERPFTCHVCGKQFRDSGGLSRHLKDVHAKLKNFTCDICANSFSSKATRDDHRRTHTGERPYNCENCEKSFKSRACLYIHSKLHTDQFPYPCAHCNKKFRRRQEMLVHVSTHTGEKNYSCDVCSRRFRVKTEVARHKLTHSDEKPYVCAKCGLSFRQNRYLNNHVKSRHSQSLND